MDESSPAVEPGGDSYRSVLQWLGLLAGPALAVICFLWLPHAYENPAGEVIEFSLSGRATLAILVWMALWWLTEAIEIYVTALLPLVMFPLLGAADMKAAAAPYAHPLIFLFMGGFLLALSMQRWGLGRRIALLVLGLVGSRPVAIIAGFMFTTALLSAFVSNTATVAMMLPIALSVVGLIETPDGGHDRETTSHFNACLMLGIAYAGSIGGITTIVGTPPNVFLISFLQDGIDPAFRQDISFVRWLAIGIPLAIVFLPIVLVLLTRFLFPIRIDSLPGFQAAMDRQLGTLGSPCRGEWVTLVVFMFTAGCWIFRPLLMELHLGSDQGAWKPLAGLTDPGIAMTGALLLFLIPADFKHRQFVMDWSTAIRLPWGILILFGGGLTLATAVTENGVAEFIASYSQVLAGMPPLLTVLLITAAMVFLTELTSNIATTATMVPILAALAPGLGSIPIC